MEPRVICLGAVNVDLRYQVPDLSPFLAAWPELRPGGEVALGPGDEPRLRDLLAGHGRPGGRWGGGQAANTAWALARMGVPTALVGRVGADLDGDFLLGTLAGVALDFLRRQGESGRAYILVDPGGERTILVAPNTNDDLKDADIPREALAAAAFVHFTSFVGEEPLKVQGRVARGLPAGPRLSLDPGELYARRGRAALAELLSRTETLMVTEEEWALLGGEPDRHPAWAPSFVLVKRGPRGARLLYPEGFQDFPPEAGTQMVDTLGAGDVFAAGYLAGRQAGLALKNAVRLAVRAAGASLAGPGRASYPDAAFLQEQLEKVK